MKKIEWFPVAKDGSLPIREGRRVLFGEYDVALFNLGEGQYLAVDNRCPHKQGPLADGILSGKNVFCPLHNWKISLETGCAIAGGQGRVHAYPVRVIDEKVCVAFRGGVLSDLPSDEVEETPTSLRGQDV